MAHCTYAYCVLRLFFCNKTNFVGQVRTILTTFQTFTLYNPHDIIHKYLCVYSRQAAVVKQVASGPFHRADSCSPRIKLDCHLLTSTLTFLFFSLSSKSRVDFLT